MSRHMKSLPSFKLTQRNGESTTEVHIPRGIRSKVAQYVMEILGVRMGLMEAICLVVLMTLKQHQNLVCMRSSKSPMLLDGKVFEQLYAVWQWNVAACLLVNSAFSVQLQQSTAALSVQHGHFIVLTALETYIPKWEFFIPAKFGR